MYCIGGVERSTGSLHPFPSPYFPPGCCPHPAQVNLDFESEKDMIEKFRVGLALQVRLIKCGAIGR